MRCADRWFVVAAVLLGVSAPASGDTRAAIHRQRYAMGTMFDIIVFHHARAEGMRAVDAAFAEIDRLERVMSHYRPDSDLSRLNREAARRPVRVDPSLHDVLRESVTFSRRSRGRFDVTIAPLLRLWSAESAPTPEALAWAGRCVGYEKIDLTAAGGIRFHSDCLEIDLGGIGKGYAVDRALAILTSAGIRHAMINAGGSSIAAVGAPPRHDGWPIELGARTVILLSGESVSTSQQNPSKPFGDIIDPATRAPAATGHRVSVVAPTATASDALSTTALMLPAPEAAALLETYPHVSAIWMSPDGEKRAAVRERRLRLLPAGRR